MLFAILYRWRGNVDSNELKKTRQLFAAWEPPPEVDLHAHYHFARGGGLVVVEADDAATLFKGLAPFTPTVEFDIEPIVTVVRALAISMDVDEWIESVAGGQATGDRGQEKD